MLCFKSATPASRDNVSNMHAGEIHLAARVNVQTNNAIQAIDQYTDNLRKDVT